MNLRDHDNSLPTIRNLPFEEEDNFDSHPHANLIFFVRPGEHAMQTYKSFWPCKFETRQTLIPKFFPSKITLQKDSVGLPKTANPSLQKEQQLKNVFLGTEVVLRKEQQLHNLPQVVPTKKL